MQLSSLTLINTLTITAKKFNSTTDSDVSLFDSLMYMSNS